MLFCCGQVFFSMVESCLTDVRVVVDNRVMAEVWVNRTLVRESRTPERPWPPELDEYLGDGDQYARTVSVRLNVAEHYYLQKSRDGSECHIIRILAYEPSAGP